MGSGHSPSPPPEHTLRPKKLQGEPSSHWAHTMRQTAGVPDTENHTPALSTLTVLTSAHAHPCPLTRVCKCTHTRQCKQARRAELRAWACGETWAPSSPPTPGPFPLGGGRAADAVSAQPGPPRATDAGSPLSPRSPPRAPALWPRARPASHSSQHHQQMPSAKCPLRGQRATFAPDFWPRGGGIATQGLLLSLPGREEEDAKPVCPVAGLPQPGAGPGHIGRPPPPRPPRHHPPGRPQPRSASRVLGHTLSRQRSTGKDSVGHCHPTRPLTLQKPRGARSSSCGWVAPQATGTRATDRASSMEADAVPSSLLTVPGRGPA